MKKEAIRLRQSGESIKVIASKLGKGVGTVHSWVKDIPLSDDKKKNLRLRGNKTANQKKAEKKKKAIESLNLTKISNNKGSGEYDPKGIGDKSEARIIAEFLDADMSILIPFGDRNRYDLLVDEKGKFIRVQCKTARLSGDKFIFKTESNNWNTGKRKSYDGDADIFAVFLRENKKVYIFNVKNVPKGYCNVRLTEDRGNNGKRFASEHEFTPGKPLLRYK